MLKGYIFAKLGPHFPPVIYKMAALAKKLATRLLTQNQINSLKRHVPPWLSYVLRPSPTASAYTWPIDVAALSKVHVANDARLYANRSDALDHLPKGGIVAEIGVAAGAFSDVILTKLSPRRFDAFDIFRLHESKFATALSTEEMFGGMSHLEYYRERYAPFVDQGQVRIIEGDSVEQLSLQPDASYDIIYIDGNHTYEGVLRDAEVASRKIKQDGFLIFNDYIMKDCFDDSRYGVVPVVNDFCVKRGWVVAYFALQRHMFCDIALKRI